MSASYDPANVSNKCPPSSNTDAHVTSAPLFGPILPVSPQNKTPVSELTELAVHMGLAAAFEVLSETGPSHNREFTILCTVGNVTAQGKEHNKRKAKHLAAAAALKKLTESEDYRHHLFNTSSKAALASHNNTVGRLQEATAKKGFPNPDYNFEQPTGAAHQRQFTTKVHVGSLTASGTGRNKKEAKRSAAAAMLDNLNCSNLSLHVPAKRIAFRPATSAIDPSPIVFHKGGTL